MAGTIDVSVGSDLLELLATNAARCERDSVIVPENITALSAAGMFRLLAPRSAGGLEVTPGQFVEICRELGRGCSSSAWVVGVMNSCTWALSRFPPSVRDHVFAGGSAPMVCGVVAPTGECVERDDRLEITGRWAYASGCLHADWALVGVRNLDNAGTTVGRGVALVPMGLLTIEHTWDAVGLSGTGSHTLSAEAVIVPRTQVIDMGVAASASRAPDVPVLYRSALMPILALALAGPILGMAQGALDTFNEDDAHARAGATPDEFVQAAAAIQGATGTALEAAAATEAWSAQAIGMPPVEQAKVKLDVAESARACRAAVDQLLDVAGVRGLSADSTLARCWRDLAVGSRHGMLNHRRVTEEYGRLLLG